MEKETTKEKYFKNLLDKSITVREVIFLIAIVLCLSPFISPPLALLMGLIIALITGHPYSQLNQKATHMLLQVSVVGLGFGMNVSSAMKAGREGILFTVITITGTLLLGFVMGKVLRIDRKTSYLISAGTAICGGSAIAAVSPVIKAEEKQISVALGTVFILNSLALLIFPVIGHELNLSQTQFGLWCAIAIHDTSSVVGAASKYGTTALEVATTVKLARALWIIPVVFLSAIIFKNKKSKVKNPLFYWIIRCSHDLKYIYPIGSALQPLYLRCIQIRTKANLIAHRLGLSSKVLKSVGFKPFIQGVVLWIIISVVSLWVITTYI